MNKEIERELYKIHFGGPLSGDVIPNLELGALRAPLLEKWPLKAINDTFMGLEKRGAIERNDEAAPFTKFSLHKDKFGVDE